MCLARPDPAVTSALTTPYVVPFAGTIKDGETVKIECIDWYVSLSLSLAHTPNGVQDGRPDQER